MYSPGYAHVEDPEIIKNFISENVFATIVSCRKEKAVHISGKLRIQSEKELAGSIEKLMKQYEDWDLSVNEYAHEISTLLKHIIGFEVKATDIKATLKLSQNRTQNELNTITSNLEKVGTESSISMAKEIRKYLALK
jgi:transcriptional regulator